MISQTKMDLLQLSLTEVSILISNMEVSPVELVDACLEQIDGVDRSLHAYISVYEEEARQVAKAAETMMMAGYALGPLHGIPIALKDNIGLKGLKTTAGSKILADWLPDQDATVAAKLKGAGAVIIGKTNLHEFAWGGTSNNPHYGTVRNPWNTDHFPAGSSGGSGVAVAARTCFGALGTDTGGSIRLPSSVNGLVGIRPTIGRVSNHGVIPLAWSMDTVGPMTRTIEDCAIMLNVIAGYDIKDGGSAMVPVSNYLDDLERGVKGMRIGIIQNYFFNHLQPPVYRAVKVAIEKLEELGAELVEVEIENIGDNIKAQLIVEACEPSAYHQKWLREQPEDYGDDVRLLLELGEMHLATHYIQAQRYRGLLRREFMDAFKQVDVFICPTLPFTATPIGETSVIIENGVKEDMLSVIMQYTGISSLTGFPALNVPCGFDDHGLPIGMQIIGRPFEERVLFRVGAAYQQVTEFHKQSPKF
jgi:aspartyl-tRNA(Asn)/glutamyl-tRNA(Gln) amidotransferase subunit A